MSLTEAPLASPASFEEFDSLEDADSDLALFTKPNLHITSALAAAFAPPTARRDSPPPVTPIEELSDLSEVILSPTFRELESAARASMMWNPHKRTASNGSASQGAYPSPRVSSHTPTTEPLMHTLISTSIPTPPASRRPSPTLTHSSEAVEAPISLPSPKPSSPPPRPVRSPRRPSLTSRNTTSAQPLPSTAQTLPPTTQTLPAPPPMAIQRQSRSATMPIPIPQPERPKQPRINPSPKILALMQQFEGVPREFDDSASISSSRRGSGSSSVMQRMEPWTYSPPSSRPGTPNSLSELGEQLLVEREPVTLSREQAATLANGSAKWQLKATPPRDNYASYSAPRSYMTPAIPGLDVQPSLFREWSQKRPKKME
ncbi:hypothetical protein FRC18_001812 [Serendipita sp. 400]|nr:hypothetical protein FRC18_001812 [Serendipita sp. 400]